MLKKIAIVFLIIISLWHCRKDVDSVTSSPSAKLSFSQTLIEFDTIFTTVGSTTHQFKVYNNSSEAIKISSVTLGGDNQAYFRMNVDGRSGEVIRDILLAGKDSLFVFVDVTIDPKDDNLPFLVEGNIQFITNGNVQDVALIAYGQQAKFITPDHFVDGLPPYSIVGKDNQTVTWPTDTPIVIYGYAVIDSKQHLEIIAGTQIYLHANSGIWVYENGQITVDGDIDNPVVFQGDRLDEYKDISGSWDRIWINEGENGKNNEFNYAVIKNAFIGIQAEYKPFVGRKDGWSQNGIIIDNTIIENSKVAGIYAKNFQIIARNTLVSSTGGSNFVTAGGGNYTFNQCTFGNYWHGEPRSTPAVFLSHLYFDFEQNVYVQDSVNAFFNNCIIYGNQESEFNIEDEIDPGTRVNFEMYHTLVKTNMDTVKYGKYTEAIINPSNENVFIDPNGDDFHLAPGSRALDHGDNGILDLVTQSDLDGVGRKNPPDLGVYEFK